MKKTKFLRKNFLKTSRGITLMVLIITIIIMLILAGVVLNIDGDGGIFSKAEKAVSETTIAMAREETEMMISKWVIRYHAENVKNQTAAEFVGGKIGDGMATSSGDFFVTMNDEIIVVYDGTEADAEHKVTLGLMASGGSIQWLELVKIPSELNVGDYVTYSPSGTYNWQAEYASSDLTPVTDDVLLSSASGEAFNLSNWRVFLIDEITGKIELVPSAPTTGTVRLQGPQGYNNAVKLLNDACDNLYGDSSRGIGARSINRDDIENIMHSGETKFAEYYKTAYPPDNSLMDENYQSTSAYTTNKNYPTIYEQEDLSTITYSGDTEETKVAVGAGLGRSEQTSLIGRTDAGPVSGEASSEGRITKATSIRPYGTYYCFSFAYFSSLLGEEYSNLLLPRGTATNYWIASRCISVHSNHSRFGVSYVGNDDMGVYNICYSSNYVNYFSRALFPVVSLSSELVSGNDTEGWKVE